MAVKNKKLGEKILNVVLNILIGVFSIILLITLYNSIQVKILGNDYSSFFGYTLFEIETGSMEPTISTGDWIIVKNDKNYEIKDIITYKIDDEFVTHRVVEEYQNSYITQGDANNTKDDPVKKNQIVGKVVKILPSFGIVRKIFFNPLVLITLIISLYFLNMFFKKKPKKENNKIIEPIEIKDDVIDIPIINDNLNENTNTIENVTVDEINEKLFNEVKYSEETKDNISELKIIDDKDVKITEEELLDEEKNILSIDTEDKIEKIDDSEVSVELIKQIEAEFAPDDELVNDIKENFASDGEENEEELSDTRFFRMISVDKSEFNNDTSSNIEVIKAKDNKVKNDKKQVKKADEQKEVKKPNVKKGEQANQEISLMNQELELIQKRNHKKYKNIIDKVMYLKEQEFVDIVNVINDNAKALANEPSIKNNFIKLYIDGRYYNYCGNVNLEFNKKNVNSRMNELLKKSADEMIKEYSGTDNNFSSKVNKYLNIMMLLNAIDKQEFKGIKINDLRSDYHKKIDKYIKMDDKKITAIINIQKQYEKYVNYSIKKMETDSFKIEKQPILKMKDFYAVDLKHNLNFSKIYSNYIVNKTYNDGLVGEDKALIELSLLANDLACDMLDDDKHSKYIVYIPEGVYAKENKLMKMYSFINDEYAKNNVLFLVRFSELKHNKKILKDLKKSGYKFAIYFNENDDIKGSDVSSITIANYVFINNKQKNYKTLVANLPENYNDRIITDDIRTKISDFGGEE